MPTEIDPPELFELLLDTVSDPALRKALEDCQRTLAQGLSGKEWSEQHDLRKGVSGWMLRTVPAALLCWLRHPADFRAAVEEVILLGGDADTTGAITGALSGATVGGAGIPQDLLDGIVDWPRSVRWIRRLAERIADWAERPGEATSPQPLIWPALLPRNLVFLLLVLVHGLRRMLPPY